MRASAAPAPEGTGARRPASALQIFRVFNGVSLRGFGGALPWAQHALVDEQRWCTRAQYLEILSLAQVLPGPNICNVALMVGDRFLGVRGACAAFAGVFAVPMLIVIALALLYANFAGHPMVAAALRGMGAVSAGLLVSMAGRLLPAQRRNVAGWIFMAATFAAVGLLRWPLPSVMLGLGACSMLLARARGPR